MRVTFVTPRIAVQKGDFLGSGVPYWPLEAATSAAFLREQGEAVGFVDLFGLAPRQLTDCGEYYLQGETLARAMSAEVLESTELFLLFALSYMSHDELLAIARELRGKRPDVRIGILENSQAVTAYSLPDMAGAFFAAGADFIIAGEVYPNWSAVRDWVLQGCPETEEPENILSPSTLGQKQVQRIIRKGIRYPIPAWDLIRLENYWSIPYSHGPKTSRFFPIFTSRGCPYKCDFCVVPSTNNVKWRGREAEEVVDEMISLRDRFGVSQFQIEDLNPTVQWSRWKRICELLIERRAGVQYAIVSGTKAETIPVEGVELMARSGCRYLSISPESGSERLMKIIGKPFDYEHGVSLIEMCRRHGIRTQACFLAGHPEETQEDFEKSKAYLRKLVKTGLDEAAIFIVAPFAGSSLFRANRIDLKNTEALPSFSPKGRSNYAELEYRRSQLIRAFFKAKLAKGGDLWMQGFRSLLGTPQTKMENLPKRFFFVMGLVGRHKWDQWRFQQGN